MLYKIFFICCFLFSISLFAQKESNYTALELEKLSDEAYFQGKRDLATKYSLLAVEKAKQVVGVKDTLYADRVKGLGSLYKVLGQYEKVLPLYNEAEAIYNTVLGENHIKSIAVLNSKGLLFRSMGDLKKALAFFNQASTAYKENLGSGSSKYIKVLNNIGSIHFSLGYYNKAIRTFEKVYKQNLEIYGVDHIEVAKSSNNLAVVYREIGDYQQALVLLEQARQIYKKSNALNPSSLAQFLSNLALLYSDMKKVKKALSLMEEVREITKKALGEKHPYYARQLVVIATLHQKNEDMNTALDIYKKAKLIFELNKKVSLEYATLLQFMGNAHRELKNYNEALSFYESSAKIYRNQGAKSNASYVESLLHKAILYKRMKDVESFKGTVQEAFEVCFASKEALKFTTNSMHKIENLKPLSAKHLEKFINILQHVYEFEALKLELGERKNITYLSSALCTQLKNQFSSEKDKLRVLELKGWWLTQQLSVFSLDSEVDLAFEVSDENKSDLLLQATRAEKAYRLGALADSIVKKDKKLKKKQSQLQAKLLQLVKEEDKGRTRNQLIKVNQSLKDLEEFIKINYPKYHKYKYEQKLVAVNEIQQQLKNGEALIEYVVTDSIVHVFCVEKNRVLWKKVSLSKKELRTKVANFHQSLSNYKKIIEADKKDLTDYVEQAHWFYQQLLAPVLEGRDAIDKLIVITDDELGHLPFESFIISKDKVGSYAELHYLLRDYSVSYNYSATLWHENAISKRKMNNGLLYGIAANYSNSSSEKGVQKMTTSQFLRANLQPLPSARKEVEALEREFNGLFAFGQDASEDAFKRYAKDYAILHFACHGVLDEKRPVLSSLVLTTQIDSAELNFLYAYEISKLELNADLAVLSACETGFGKFEQGNGVASLARSFMYAGVPSLVVSLWQVNDDITSVIMSDFYHNLSSGMSKDEALRMAKIAYLNQAKDIAAHPAFWSPFIQMGKIDAVDLSLKSTQKYLYVGLFLLVLLLGGVIVKKRKKS